MDYYLSCQIYLYVYMRNQEVFINPAYLTGERIQVYYTYLSMSKLAIWEANQLAEFISLNLKCRLRLWNNTIISTLGEGKAEYQGLNSST